VACGGWRKAVHVLKCGASYTRGDTPAGARVTLRALSQAAREREVEASLAL